MRVITYCFLILIGLGSLACNPANKAAKADLMLSPRVGFYNVENLFDLQDDPNTRDEDFTPEGRNKWTKERYQTKLSRLHQIIRGMGYPVILGLCEVENEEVVKDLADSCKTKTGKYAVVHYDSQDQRGIDVALMYQPAVFEVLTSAKITTSFPPIDGKPYTSRDILHVTGMYRGKHRLHVFVNHWPSRRGGLEASEPRRVLVANNLRKAIDKINEEEENPKIIIMGDFNDEPSNKSLEEVLMATKPTEQMDAKTLYNCSYPSHSKGLGTYNYRGNWNQLDQIIVSGELASGRGGLKVGESQIYREEWMMYEDKKFGARPSRTYGGPNYYGGYSDHLPIYAELSY